MANKERLAHPSKTFTEASKKYLEDLKHPHVVIDLAFFTLASILAINLALKVKYNEAVQSAAIAGVLAVIAYYDSKLASSQPVQKHPIFSESSQKQIIDDKNKFRK